MSKQAAGGRARAEKLTPEERSAIAKKAADAMWGKDIPDDSLPKATHHGELVIGNTSIPCAVLTDGTRVLSETGLAQALLGTRSGASKRIKKAQEYAGALTPVFLAPGNLKPYIPEDLTSGPLVPISYRVGRRVVSGFNADILPAACDVWLKARSEGALQPQQLVKAQNAEILMRGLAHVGIRALVDEATGYQAERDRDDLHKFLSHYLSAERLKWAARFPKEFFDHIFRLRGWHKPLDPNKRPRAMGIIINKIVYDQLPDGVVEELQDRNPVDYDSKRRKWKHHQFLSEDIGQPDLRAHIQQLLVLMRISDGWSDFERHFIRAFSPSSGVQPPLGLPEDME